MTKSPAPPGFVRKPMGPTRLTFIAIVVLIIAGTEYDWLTTPWWQKTMRICGSFGLSDMVADLRSWLGW